jgi:hypothetical protein
MAVRHIGRNGLGGVAGDRTEWDGGYWDIHLGEGSAKSVDCVAGGLGCVAEIGGYGFGAVHAVGRESRARCWCGTWRWDCESRKSTQAGVWGGECGEHLVGWSGWFLGGPGHLSRFHMLKLDELLDVVLRITGLNVAEAGFFQMAESRNGTRTEDV